MYRIESASINNEHSIASTCMDQYNIDFIVFDHMSGGKTNSVIVFKYTNSCQ